MMNMNNMNRMTGASWSSASDVDFRAARFVHSLVSLDSVSMIASTPRSIPPSKSPALKRGATAARMITLDTASVKTPSSP